VKTRATLRVRLDASCLVFGAFAIMACNGGDPPPPSDGGEVDTGYEGEESDDGKPELICLPGETQCADEGTMQVCAATGLEWESSACSEFSSCVSCEEEDGESCTAQCKGPCESEDELPGSAGCSFMASRMLHLQEGEPDGLVVGNPNSTAVATITLFQVPEGKRTEEIVEGPLEVPPGEHYEFQMDINFIDIAGFSRFRTGGIYRLQSDIPVVAYQHAPYRSIRANDASLLMPDTALRRDYVVASYPPYDSTTYGYPSYFSVIAIEDDTEIQWTPPTATVGNGFPIDFVGANKTGKLAMNRFDMARIAASSESQSDVTKRDVSGTVISSNKPIWVVGAVRGARVPNWKQGTDHLQEMLLPLDYWGDEYVAAPSPDRGDEPHIWRVFAASKDGVTITADPPVIEPIVLEKRGDWTEFQVPNGTGFVLSADRPFLPVQYLASHDLSAKIGDPSMYQMVAIDQFLDRYVFVTGQAYDFNYAQIIRNKGGADVTVTDENGDPEVVTGYYTIGDYEVADWLISEGAHRAESDDPFGVIQVGYSAGAGGEGRASYGYPGGMKVEEIYIP
jgi:hypothetical protein